MKLESRAEDSLLTAKQRFSLFPDNLSHTLQNIGNKDLGTQKIEDDLLTVAKS